MLHGQHEQGIQDRSRKSRSGTPSGIGLQMLHRCIEFGTAPEQIKFLPNVRISLVDHLEVYVVFDHAKALITFHHHDDEKEYDCGQHDEKNGMHTRLTLALEFKIRWCQTRRYGAVPAHADVFRLLRVHSIC